MIIHAVVGNLIDLGEQHVHTTEDTLCLVCKWSPPLTDQHHRPYHHQYFNLKLSEKSDYKCVLVLISAAHILKLEQYRYLQGPWARMTCKSVKCSYIFYLSKKQKETHRHRRQTCGCQGGSRVGEKDWEFGIRRCKLLSIGWINNEALLYSTGN